MSTTPSTSSWEHTPENRPARLLFFGNDFPSDHAGNLFRVLSRTSAHLKCPQLAHFIRLCNHALKDEISKLPKRWQDDTPCFDNVLDLIDDEKFRKGPLGGAVEGVFLIIFQIGMLIGHHEVDSTPYEFGPRSAPTLAGLGVGLLSAAAVSSAPDLATLASTGAEAVRVAFRLGIHVYDSSDQLEPPQKEVSDPWAFVVPGLSAEDVQAELDSYNKKTATPVFSRIFISASDQTSVTVSGPPTRLRNCLKSSAALRYSNFFPLPVHHGLCHAPHIYSASDVQAIMAHVSDEDLKEAYKRPILNPLLSSDTGLAYEADDLHALLGQLVDEILMHKMHIDNVAKGIAATLEQASSSDAQHNLALWTFRSSMVLKAIIRGVEGRCEGRVALTQHDLVEWSKKDDGEAQIPSSPKRSKLAVVGMSCRLPGGANDLELFWKLMVDKRDVHTRVPPDRFDLDTHFDPTGQTENATQTPFMNHMENPGHFDAGFFNISPKEAEQMDPMHRLALVTAYEALEMSGYAPNRTRSTSSSRIGTYYGQASDDWRELNASQNIGTYAVPSGERGFANGRINYFFKFSGPSFNMDTACSSGLAAVNAACSALWAGEVDTALAGGLNVITDPDNFCQLGKGHFLSLTGQCKVWDEAADGYCRADGVGSVVIKRLDDALADNDNILATILAANTNHSAEAISITHPHAPTQAENYRKVMAKAGVSPLDVNYVELHGTGTQAGDREEARSVSDVFAPAGGPGQRRKKQNRLRLGAVKSNIGHGEAAAGIASFIKVLLMYQKNAIPPQIGVAKLNPTLPQDLEERNIGLNWEHHEWPRTARPNGRLAIVNSFGAHGGNTTVLLADSPPSPYRQVAEQDPRSTFPLVLSARSKASLKMNAEALLAYLDENGDGNDLNLGHLSYTLTARRMHHPFRIGAAVKDLAAARRFLTAELDKMRDQPQKTTSVPLKSPTIAFAFTGQGAFYKGMGAQLYANCAIFRGAVDRLDRLAQSLSLGVESVIPVINGSVADEDVSPVTSQLAIVLIELALTHYWAALGIKPSMVMGHSLGEFAALAAAGVLSDLDALCLAAERAKLMTSRCEAESHGMLAVRCTLDQLSEHLEKHEDEYEVACINGESDLVISASKKKLAQLSDLLTSSGVKSTALKVPYAFHSEQMEPIVAPFLEVAEHAVYKAPRIPVISPLLAECIFDSKTLNHKYLGRATREPVDVVGALDAAQELGLVDADTVWIDIGPHVVAGSMVRNIMGPVNVVASMRRGEDDLVTIASSLTALHLAGVPVSWNEYFRQHERAHQVLHLPTYRWNNKNYWIPYLGTWTLDKANIKHSLETQQSSSLPGMGLDSRLKTSTIHGIVSESVDDTTASLVTLSNLLDPAFLEAVEGHRMNNHGVASSSIWADMAFTVGKYLHELVFPQDKDFHMNLLNMEILHAQIAGSPQDKKQLIQLEATLDIASRCVTLFLYNMSSDGTRAADHYGSCEIRFEDPTGWDREWKRVEHLVVQRVESLHRLAAVDGTASRVNRNMAYKLFKNVVDYADHYRGMQSVIIQDYEAVADVVLDPEERGVWQIPPHWTDSLCHLGGFVMNGSDASNTADYFYVTPGWESFRLRRAPKAGGKYRSYVRMVPTEDDPKVWAGDVYILQDDTVVGMMAQMKFKQINRILMDRFFSPAASATHSSTAITHAASNNRVHNTVKPSTAGLQKMAKVVAPPPVPEAKPAQEAPPAAAPVAAAPEPATTTEEPGSGRDSNPLIAGAVALISSETGIDSAELTDDTTFVQIGVDSLMSLVLVEKFKAQLKVEIKSSLFIECDTLGQFKEWLEENR